MGNILDLSTANTKGIEPVDSGRYAMHIDQAEWAETKGKTEHNPNAKLPAGCPILKVQLRFTDKENYGNRVVFDQFVIPPEDYDAGKRSTMLGSLARFLIAAGYGDDEVKSKKFKLDLDDLTGREVTVTLGKGKDLVDPDQQINVVKGYKPAGAELGSTSTSGLM